MTSLHMFRSKLLMTAALLAAPLLVSPAYAAPTDESPAKKYEASADALIAKNDLKGAVVELKNAVKAAPNDAALRLKLAGIDLRLTDVEGAEIELKAAKEHGADDVKYIPLLARTYIMQGKYDKLLTDLVVEEDAAPAVRAAILIARADAQMNLKQIDAARSSLAAAEQLEPQNVGPKLGLARIALTQNQPEDALKKADEIFQIAPTADAHILKGEILNRKGDRDGAVAAFTDAIKIDPNNIGGYLDRAQTLVAQNKDAEAEADVKVVLASAARSVPGNYLEALIMARRKDFNGADTILTKIASTFPDFPRGFYLQAVVKSALKQYEQAETTIRAYLGRVPDDPLGEKVLADTLLHKGDPNGAAENLEKVVAQSPDDFQALTMLGQAYMQARKPQQAVEVFEKAEKLKPDDPGVLRGLALNHIAEGQSATGTSELEKSLQLSPDDQPAAETLVAIYIREKAYDKAQNLIDDLRKRKPNDPVAPYMAGQMQLAQYHLPEAEAAFQAVVQQFPDFSPAKMQIAYIEAVQGRTDDASKVYKTVLAKDPTNIQALQNLSILYEAQKQPDPVVDIWQKAHLAQPDNLPIALGLIRSYVAKKDPEAGLAVIRDMQLRQPNAPQLYAMRAELEIVKNTPKDAVVSLQRLVEMKPQDGTARRDLAVAQDKAGDLPGAIATIGDARKLDPNNLGLAAEEVQLVGEQSPDDGIAAARKVASQMPEQPAAQAMEGDYLVSLKRPADSVAAYQRSFQAHPSIFLVERLTAAAIRDGKPDDAGKLLADWSTAHPDDLAAKFDLAQFYLQQKNYAEAKPRYEELLKARPDNPIVLNDLAWMVQRDGDTPRALDLAKKANAAAPRSSDVADTLGWIMVQQSDVPNGLKYLQQASVGAPGNGEILYHLGYALDRSGQKAQALEVLKKAVAVTQDFESKKDAQALLAQLSKG